MFSKFKCAAYDYETTCKIVLRTDVIIINFVERSPTPPVFPVVLVGLFSGPVCTGTSRKLSGPWYPRKHFDHVSAHARTHTL